MKFSTIWHTMGYYLLFYSFCFLPSLLVATIYNEWTMATLFGGIFIGLLLLGGGIVLLFSTRKRETHFTKKEGLLTVSLIWIVSGIIGGLPFYISSYIPQIVSSIFESVSGFTTTGASVLTDIEVLPYSLLFWRSFTHFLGGLGIVVLFVAVLPYLGVGGRVLFQSEVPGPEAESLRPKIRETAVALLKIYLFFTLIETIMLMFCGMNLFDSLCHTFGSLATGGFSTKNASIGYYNSVSIEIVIIFFMVLAGANFSLYFYFLKGQRKIFWRDLEFKIYIGILIFASLFITLNLTFFHRANFWLNLRESFFHVVSIQTTTGYGAGNFEQWPDFSKLLLLVLMLVGGCAGSTGGGLKVIRWIIVFKYIGSHLKQVFSPHAVVPVKIQKRALGENMVKGVVALFCLWILIFGVVSLLLTATGVDLTTATSATLATLNNIGPGLGDVGPVDNYSMMSEWAKALLILCMLFGRLEVYTLIILFLPSFWKR